MKKSGMSLILLGFMASLILMSFVYVPRIDSEEVKSTKASCAVIIPNPNIHILSWTAYTMFTQEGENQAWFEGFGSFPIDVCYSSYNLDPKYKCSYTNEKTQLSLADVVLFRGRRLDYIPLPTARRWNQSWVFFEFEPPFKVWEKTNLTKYNGVFNLTFTHSFTADMAYTHYLSKQCLRNDKRYDEYKLVDYTVNKTRDVPIAWMVSVCTSQSKREDFVENLQKHIPVDIYGECGKLQCGSNNLSTWKADNCDEQLFTNKFSYRFYLAFENSICEDYISEKLWRLMKMNIVPVVMGAVDYSNLLPKDTYINARDFKTPKKLAEFLKELISDKKAYNGYIQRKNALDCHNTVPYVPKQCFLCRRLHEIRSLHLPRVVMDLEAMYGEHHCVDPKKKLEKTTDW